ncbi:BlaI/MecI/CopY family transcriptional regulator [Candidatus Woesearchaeota archaeon]|nr:BlaI/MecI/CopY family transcriptional regulator [Candidatus Woesearchaeota archaeon]
MDRKKLTTLGLTEAEARIYTSVLKLGMCTVKDITKECGFHRTNIYDVLEQLKEKGLVAYAKEGKTMQYTVSDPQNLYELLREKKEVLDSIFPEIERLHDLTSKEIQVEVYKGEEGMKSAFRDILRQRKTLYAFGVKGQLREKLPLFAEQWLRDLKEKKIAYYGIYTERVPPKYYTKIRYVAKELSGPVATFIYGDKININIWDPTLVSIIITSKLVAQMYKKHFELLWKVAKR